jgi:uncharacterized protein
VHCFYQPRRQNPITGMAEFVCNWCGKCCRSFGEFIRIERQLTERDYYCRYDITNELFLIHVNPDYAEEISDTFSCECEEPGAEGKICPFSRKNPRGEGFLCAIYPTRPPVCRDFRCYRMLIHNPEGNVVGKVIGQNELRSKDGNLISLWKEKISNLPHTHRQNIHDPVWLSTVQDLLARHGYRGDPVQ